MKKKAIWNQQSRRRAEKDAKPIQATMSKMDGNVAVCYCFYCYCCCCSSGRLVTSPVLMRPHFGSRCSMWRADGRKKRVISARRSARARACSHGHQAAATAATSTYTLLDSNTNVRRPFLLQQRGVTTQRLRRDETSCTNKRQRPTQNLSFDYNTNLIDKLQ